jgi:hypothetical protein
MTKRLQKCLQMALADDVFLSRLTTRSEEHGCAVQDMLSLATGDYEGAMEVALALRQSTVDMTNCRGFICPLREAFGLSAKEFQVAIDARTATRTPIDFFCRCSKADFLRSSRQLSPSIIQQLRQQPQFVCSYCRKSFAVSEAEWSDVLQSP